MALTSCPECNKQISDKALSCPHCGQPFGKHKSIIHTSQSQISPQTRKRNIYLRYAIPIGVLIACLGGIYAMPFIKANQIESNLKNGNAEALSKNIDSTTLKGNLKNHFNVLIQKDIKSDSEANPFSGVGQNFASNIIDQLIDQNISSQGISKLISENSYSTYKINGFEIQSSGYTSFNEFFITASNLENETIKLQLIRRGLDWVLTDIIFPESVFSEIKKSISIRLADLKDVPENFWGCGISVTSRRKHAQDAEVDLWFVSDGIPNPTPEREPGSSIDLESAIAELFDAEERKQMYGIINQSPTLFNMISYKLGGSENIYFTASDTQYRYSIKMTFEKISEEYEGESVTGDLTIEDSYDGNQITIPAAAYTGC